MKKTTNMKTFYLLSAIINFIIFAFDLEYDRDVITWIWLLNSILSFILLMFVMIKEEIQKINNKKD